MIYLPLPLSPESPSPCIPLTHISSSPSRNPLIIVPFAGFLPPLCVSCTCPCHCDNICSALFYSSPNPLSSLSSANTKSFSFHLLAPNKFWLHFCAGVSEILRYDYCKRKTFSIEDLVCIVLACSAGYSLTNEDIPAHLAHLSHPSTPLFISCLLTGTGGTSGGDSS